jgi:hypothetical protein
MGIITGIVGAYAGGVIGAFAGIGIGGYIHINYDKREWVVPTLLVIGGVGGAVIGGSAGLLTPI